MEPITPKDFTTFERVEFTPSPELRGRILLPAKKVVLACPTYGPVDPYAAKTLRAATMHAASNGWLTWAGDVSPDRMVHAAARNVAAKAALESGADGVMWVDSDIILPIDAISRIMNHVHNGQIDFVSGVYFQRRPPHWPLIAKFDPEINAFRWMMQWPRNVIFQADGVGFGCVYTSTRLLQEMMVKLESVQKTGWFEYSQFSEDFTFCKRAGEIGYRPYVDTAILCGHQGEPDVVTVEEFRSHNPYTGDTAAPIAATGEVSNGELSQ